MSNIVPGSLQAIAAQEGQSLAQSFMQADVIVLVDTSASMGACDVAGEIRLTRYEAACAQLRALQADHPGRVAVISFSSHAAFCPGGVPTNLQGGTDMAAALDYVRPADGCGVRFVLISDGEPDSEDRTLQAARQFTDPIETIFIGSGPGAAFLARLASLTGGRAMKRSIPQLAQAIAGMLPGKAA